MPGHQGDDRSADIEARQTAARKFGFVLGCVAAAIAMGIQIVRLRVFLTLPAGSLTAGVWWRLALMASLNIPLGILFALIGERVSRNRSRGD